MSPLSLPSAALNQQGYFASEDVLFWRGGQGEWKPLRELSDLHAALQQPPPEGYAGGGGEAADAAAAVGAAQPEAPQRRRGKGKKGAAAAAVPSDPALAGFLSEISALEAGEEGAAEGGAPASPPPDERRFEDDDGTWWAQGGRRELAEVMVGRLLPAGMARRPHRMEQC